MTKPLVLSFSVFFSLIALLLIFGCSKAPSVEPVLMSPVTPAPVVMAPAVQPAVVVAPTPVTNPPVVIVAKKVSKKHHVSRGLKAEKAAVNLAEINAYAKAYHNAALANHLLGRAKYRTHA